jgi:hypothetical protein
MRINKRRANRKRIKDKYGLRSGLELLILKALRQIQRTARFILGYETDKFSYTLLRRYTPDFTVTLRDGKRFFIEVKGYLRPEDRAKLLAVKRDNPDLDLRLVFGRDNPLRKGAKMTYSEWATKNNIPYAIGTPPKEWFIEETT